MDEKAFAKELERRVNMIGGSIDKLVDLLERHPELYTYDHLDKAFVHLRNLLVVSQDRATLAKNKHRDSLKTFSLDAEIKPIGNFNGVDAGRVSAALDAPVVARPPRAPRLADKNYKGSPHTPPVDDDVQFVGE